MDDSDDFSKKFFETCFSVFNKDSSSTVEKDEMTIFIKKVTGV